MGAQWNSKVEQCGGKVEQCGGTVKQCGGTVEHRWWNSVINSGTVRWNSVVEQWNSNAGTVKL